jgi:hypothetical protein
MKQPEYTEGREATENFERGMKALFRVPKTVSEMQPKSNAKKAKKKREKPAKRGPSRDAGGDT